MRDVSSRVGNHDRLPLGAGSGVGLMEGFTRSPDAEQLRHRRLLEPHAAHHGSSFLHLIPGLHPMKSVGDSELRFLQLRTYRSSDVGEEWSLGPWVRSNEYVGHSSLLYRLLMVFLQSILPRFGETIPQSCSIWSILIYPYPSHEAGEVKFHGRLTDISLDRVKRTIPARN